MNAIEAAARIERDPESGNDSEFMEAVARLLREMHEALEPFARIAEGYADDEDGDHQVWQDFDVLGASLPLSIFRRARQACEAKP